MSNRRKLCPDEIARRDQALAAARDAATDPGTAVIVVDYAPPGTQCSWCDCPSPLDDPRSPHREPGYKCAGCPEEANKVIRDMYGTAQEEAVPVCPGHHADAAAFLMRVYAGSGRPA